jgi:flagellum-specific peptidoglycan hydrolase FlgJ
LVRTSEFLKDDKQGWRFPKVYSIAKVPSGRYKYIVDDWFRDYDNVEDCILDHAKILLQPNFKHALGEKDPKEYVRKIQAGEQKYATAENYVTVMCAVIDTVKRYIK